MPFVFDLRKGRTRAKGERLRGEAKDERQKGDGTTFRLMSFAFDLSPLTCERGGLGRKEKDQRRRSALSAFALCL